MAEGLAPVERSPLTRSSASKQRRLAHLMFCSESAQITVSAQTTSLRTSGVTCDGRRSRPPAPRRRRGSAVPPRRGAGEG